MTIPKLKVDSPALHSYYVKSLTEPHLKMIEKAYEITANSPSCRLEYKQRTSGSNFNPAPARVLEILSKNAQVNNLTPLISALAAVSLESIDQLQQIALSLEITPVIQQAVLLDQIRHLSFTPDPQTKYKQLEYQWENIKLENNLNQELTTKIENALKMYGRQYQST